MKKRVRKGPSVRDWDYIGRDTGEFCRRLLILIRAESRWRVIGRLKPDDESKSEV